MFRIIRWAIIAAAVIAAWFFFAPTQLGGADTYVITDGVSMLPTIHGGALVIARQAPEYRPGEVAAYHNAQLGNAIVLHRIIRIRDGHYTFKGDNNRTPDLFPPTKSHIVGREWLYWPSGGRFLEHLRTPWIGSLVFAIVGMWAFADVLLPSKRPRPQHRRRHPHLTDT